MMLFLLHDAERLECRLGPSLGNCAHRRSFAPLHQLLEDFKSDIHETARRFHLGPGERPNCLNRELRFDRRTWRQVAGELLLLLATESPSFPVTPELLARFIDPALVARLHRGSRDLWFGGMPYRPDRSAWHARPDLVELAGKLAGIDLAGWSTEVLIDVPIDERPDELEFARQRFRDLKAMIESARDRGQVIVCEEV